MSEPDPDSELNFEHPEVRPFRYMKPNVSPFNKSMGTKELLPSVELNEVQDVIEDHHDD